MAYSEKVVDHYENPRNVGSFDKGDDSVGTGMVGAPACGDVMKPRAFWKPLDAVELPFLKWVERVRFGGIIERATGMITIAGEHGAV